MAGFLFYTASIAFTSGIFIRSFFDVGVWEVLCMLLVAGACVVAWRAKASGFRAPLFLTALALTACALGMWHLDRIEATEAPLARYVGETVSLAGVVVREPDVREHTQHLYVEEETTGEIVLVTADRFLPIQYGDRVSVEGKVTVPETFEGELGRTFNYPGYLKARGVAHMVSYGDIVVLEGGYGNALLIHLYEGKHAFMRVLEVHIPEPEAGLGEGLLLGVKRALGEDLEAIFREVGIIHIVVLSGYNIMIVVEAIMRLLAYVAFPRTRLIIGVSAIAIFALLVGLSATVVRASIMATLVLVARATGRTYAIVRALTFAGLVMLLLNPYLLAFDPGFQLSFLATLGLIFLAPLLDARFTRVPSALGVREFLTATLATQIFVLPLLLYQMGLFSVVSVIVNVLVLPMVPLAMLATFLTGVAGALVPLLGTLMGFLAYGTLTYIVRVAELFGALPFASFVVPAFPFWVVVVLYGVLVCVLVYITRTATKKESALESAETADDHTYDDWTIVGETEKPRETRSVSRGDRIFPFR